MTLIECLILFAVALVVTVAFIPLVKRLAIKLDAIDYPNARRVNTKPIPRIGGVAMFAGIVFALAALTIGAFIADWYDPFIANPHEDVNYIGVGISIIVMFLVGFIDDVKTLSPKVKFLGQIIAACIAAASGLLFAEVLNPFGSGYIQFGFWAYPITVFYLVAFANIINLIDGLDGLAAGITVISTMAVFVLSIQTGQIAPAILCIIVIGACVGFLFFNFNPASIFMGDSGALTLGYLIGCISLLAIARSAMIVSLLVPILAAGVPVLDTSFAIIRRLREHKSIGEADKGHIHHRLLASGLSQKKTVLIMWGWTAALAILGVLITYTYGWVRWVLVAMVAAITIFGVLKLKLIHPVLLHHYSPRSKQISSDKDLDGGSGAVSNGGSGDELDNASCADLDGGSRAVSNSGLVAENSAELAGGNQTGE